MSQRNVKVRATSKAAYYSLDGEKISETMFHIQQALKKIGKGMYEDIARACGMENEQVWKRLSEMEKLKLIHRTEETAETSKGRIATVWEFRPAYEAKKLDTPPDRATENTPRPSRPLNIYPAAGLAQASLF